MSRPLRYPWPHYARTGDLYCVEVPHFAPADSDDATLPVQRLLAAAKAYAHRRGLDLRSRVVTVQPDPSNHATWRHRVAVQFRPRPEPDGWDFHPTFGFAPEFGGDDRILLCGVCLAEIGGAHGDQALHVCPKTPTDAECRDAYEAGAIPVPAVRSDTGASTLPPPTTSLNGQPAAD